MSNSALIEDLERQFSENPRRVFARLANEYRKSGNLEGAIALCREHVPRHPGYISGHIVLGQALFESGATAEAKQAFEAALQLDPENLIALRYLGDISRHGGEAQEAIGWYRRLLEVDPQNEEAAAQIRFVEEGGAEIASGSAAAGAASVASETAEPIVAAEEGGPAHEAGNAADAAAVSWSDINPERDDSTVEELAAVSEALSGAEVPALESGVEQAFPDVAATEEEEEGAEQAERPSDPPVMEWDGGLVAPIFGSSDGTVDHAAAEQDAKAEGFGSHNDAGAFATGDIVPERDPFEHDDELAGPLEIAMPKEDIVELPDAGAFEQPPPTASAEADEAFGWPGERARAEGEETAAHADGDGSEFAGALHEYAAEEHAEEHMVGSDQEEETPTADTGEPALVTETVAELYERQGHLSQSLEVYRQLAAQNPGNEAIRFHVERLEQELATMHAQTAPERVGDAVEPAPEQLAERAEEPGDVEPERPLASQAYEAHADAPTVHVESVPSRPRGESARAVFRRVLERRLSAPAPAVPPTESLFPGSQVASTDDSAAATLAGAFAPEFSGGAQPAGGRPARAATDELSLDAIFGRPGGKSGQVNGEVSFDEFFPNAKATGSSTLASRPSEGGADDDEIFHSWLDGLKR